MKRWICLACSVAMLITLMACGDSQQSVVPPTEDGSISAPRLTATPLGLESPEEKQPSRPTQLPTATINIEPTQSQPKDALITEDLVLRATPVSVTDGVTTPDISKQIWVWVSTTEGDTIYPADAWRAFSFTDITGHPVIRFRSECIDYYTSVGNTDRPLEGLLFEMSRVEDCSTFEEAKQWIERVSWNTTGVFLNKTDLILEIDDGSSYMLFR